MANHPLNGNGRRLERLLVAWKEGFNGITRDLERSHRENVARMNKTDARIEQNDREFREFRQWARQSHADSERRHADSERRLADLGRLTANSDKLMRYVLGRMKEHQWL